MKQKMTIQRKKKGEDIKLKQIMRIEIKMKSYKIVTKHDLPVLKTH